MSIPEPNCGCWLWVGAGGRYGRITLPDGLRAQDAHRTSFLAFKGKLKRGEVVRHRCDVMICVNPDHLEAGTHAQNMQDRNKRGRTARQQGERNGASKLTDEKVRYIRSDPRSDYKIAKELGVSQTTVNRARRGLIWRHV